MMVSSTAKKIGGLALLGGAVYLGLQARNDRKVDPNQGAYQGGQQTGLFPRDNISSPSSPIAGLTGAIGSFLSQPQSSEPTFTSEGSITPEPNFSLATGGQVYVPPPSNTSLGTSKKLAGNRSFDFGSATGGISLASGSTALVDPYGNVVGSAGGSSKKQTKMSTDPLGEVVSGGLSTREKLKSRNPAIRKEGQREKRKKEMKT